MSEFLRGDTNASFFKLLFFNFFHGSKYSDLLQKIYFKMKIQTTCNSTTQKHHHLRRCIFSLVRWLRWLEHSPIHLGCGFDPWSGDAQGATDQCSSHTDVFLFLPPFFSLKTHPWTKIRKIDQSIDRSPLSCF